MTERDHLTWGELLLMRYEPDSEGVGHRHLEECGHCRERLERLKGWIEVLPEALGSDAPDLWVRRAQQRAVPRSFTRPLRGAYTAQVVFDSGEQARVGVRSAGSTDHQWLLATERLEIEVTLSREGDDSPFGVSGQIFAVAGEPPPLSGCIVRLEVQGETRDETRSEPHGEFLIRARPTSPFRLVVTGEGWEVATPDLAP